MGLFRASRKNVTVQDPVCNRKIHEKSLKSLKFQALSGGGHGKKLNVYPLQLLRFRDLFFRQPHTRTQLINDVFA